jgi:D-3-phosphoglycerate dehydrogenase
VNGVRENGVFHKKNPPNAPIRTPSDNPIFTLPNVLVTPHVAYYSEESIRAARVTAATQVAKVLTGQKPDYTVNAEALAVTTI